MKRFTMLLAVTCLFAVVSLAQGGVLPTADIHSKTTLTGTTVSEVAPYGASGIIFISNDGTNDVIQSTTDGTSYTNVESLVSGSAKALYGWNDSEVAFYLGESVSDGLGKELRKYESGTAAALKDHAEESDDFGGILKGVLTSVGRYYNNDLGAYDYHYLYQNQSGGNTVIEPSVYEMATGDLYSMNAPGNFAVPYIQSEKGRFNSIAFNGSYYYTAGVTSGWGGIQALYEVDYSNYTLINKFQADDDLVSLYSFMATFNQLFFLQGLNDWSDASLFCMGTDGVVNRVQNNGDDVMVDDAVPMHVLNNKLYAVVNDKLTSIAWDMDFATMSWGWKFDTYHLNAEGESDNIADMAVSNGIIYVLAAKTGSETGLYAINPVDQAVYVDAMPDNIALSNVFNSLTAINGGVAFLGNNGSSDVVYISDGNDGNTKQLLVNGAPTLAISQMHSTGDNLYIFSENGADTDIYHYSVQPFNTQTITVTILEEATDNPIQDAAVRFNNGLNRYSGTTDANGEVTITAPYGYLDVTVEGPLGQVEYVILQEEYYVGATNNAVTFKLKTGKQFTVDVKDAQTNNSIVDVTVTFTNQNDASAYSTIITSDVLGNPADNTLIVPIGTYVVKVEHADYSTYMESGVVVDANTDQLAYVLESIPTGIEDTEITKVRVYPNPAVDFIVFESANAIQSVEIYSVNGAKVKALNNDKITRINISELPKGLYLVATTDSNGQRQITKINKR